MQEVADEINISRALGLPLSIPRVGRERSTKEETVYVYFIKPDGDEVVKIGQAIDVNQRLADLQIANYKKLSVLASAELPVGFEGRFHKFLDHSRIRGEWFWLNKEVLEVIEFVKTGDRWAIESALNPKPKKLLYRRH